MHMLVTLQNPLWNEVSKASRKRKRRGEILIQRLGIRGHHISQQQYRKWYRRKFGFKQTEIEMTKSKP